MKIGKRILSTFLVVLICLTAAPLDGFVDLELPDLNTGGWLESIGDVFSSKASAATEIYYTYTVSNGEATITGFDTSISGDIIIPSTLGGYPVTTIRRWAFAWCNSLASVTIPDSVTTIGEEAFYHCESLEKVTIGNSVTTIGKETFMYCYSLTSITIPDSVTTIGEWAFGYCDDLTSVTIGNGVTTIGDRAFCRCRKITSVTIGNSVTTIGESAFYNCENLAKIIIPDSVTTIGEKAFYYCESLAKVTIGNSVTTIGKDAFRGCHSLTSIIIPDSVTTICDFAFYYCENLTKITIGNSVVSIGECAFENCFNLKSISIPDSVTYVGDYAFNCCFMVNKITIPASVEYIGPGAFGRCWYVESINLNKNNPYYITDDYGVLYNKDMTELIQYPLENGITEYMIPDSVQRIENNAFYSACFLKSLIIPSSVTEIGASVFGDMSKLTDIYYTGTSNQWQSISLGENNTALTNVNMHYNYGVSAGEDIEWEIEDGDKLCIRGTGTAINDFAMGGAPWYDYKDEIKQIYIFDSYIETIGQYAFYGLENVKHIHISCSDLDYIGQYAFYGLNSMKQNVIFTGTESQWKKIKIDYGNDVLKRYGAHCTVTDTYVDGENIKVESEPPMTEQTFVSEHVELAQEPAITNIVKNYGFDNLAVIKQSVLAGYRIWDLIGDAGEVITFDFNNLSFTANYYQMYLSDMILALNSEENIGAINIKIVETYKKYYDIIEKILKADSTYNNASKTVQKEILDAFKNPNGQYSSEVKRILGISLENIFKSDKSKFKPIFGAINNVDKFLDGIFIGTDIVNMFIKAYNAVVISVAFYEVNDEFFNVCSQAANKMAIYGGSYDSKFKYAIADARQSELGNFNHIFDATWEICKGSVKIAYDKVLKDVIRATAYPAVAKLLGVSAGGAAIAAFVYRGTYGILDYVCKLGCSKEYKIMNSIIRVERQLQSIVESYKTALLSNPTEENAKKYDMAFRILRQTNIYLYETDYKYCAVKKDTNEMQKATLYKNAWQNVMCHYNTYGDEYSLFSVHCPVDVYIYNSDGILVTSFVNDEIVEYNSVITVMVSDGQKTFAFPADENYQIVIKARENGTMDYSVSKISGESTQMQMNSYSIPLEENQEFAVNTTANSSNMDDFKLTTNNESVSFDYVSTETCSEHSFGEWVIDGNSKTRICLVCAFRDYALYCNHGENVEMYETVPTCTESGKTIFICSNCTEKIEDGKTVDALGHNYEVTSVAAPTCTEQGYTTYTCTCGDSYNDDYVDATGHSEEKLSGCAATCTETGLTDGVKCTVCGEILVAQEVINETGHSEEKLTGYKATCTENGLTDGVKCTVCGETLVAQQTIYAKGHSWGDWNVIDDSEKEHTCSVCGETETEDLNCNCNCHSDNAFVQFFYKIARFFWKLFSMQNKRFCACGKAHW